MPSDTLIVLITSLFPLDSISLIFDPLFRYFSAMMSPPVRRQVDPWRSTPRFKKFWRTLWSTTESYTDSTKPPKLLTSKCIDYSVIRLEDSLLKFEEYRITFLFYTGFELCFTWWYIKAGSLFWDEPKYKKPCCEKPYWTLNWFLLIRRWCLKTEVLTCSFLKLLITGGKPCSASWLRTATSQCTRSLYRHCATNIRFPWSKLTITRNSANGLDFARLTTLERRAKLLAALA